MPAQAHDATTKFDRDVSLRTFAAEMLRESAALERAIVDEEKKAGRDDPSDIRYPMTAKAMRDRRQKITLTLVTLKSMILPSEAETPSDVAPEAGAA